ncbi:putative L-glutamine-D-fructose-6-phosphate amidotransferase [Actinoplanes missouriensis 431]|uniref:Glutamine--fructose-6-phosphate aminotransferase [isomerizing] n=1 Tax=Actinoplanes missouriensis (strain ATCC 14538 / DSM 43046 / CBS 188.64 / JCM 3121 / NBRC 102363 / NCIMB 12654 / NRRL B-3342 / UNCC 431) TaxID=512565 RepID=I0HHG0_ACTM4|nr:glutamine--fructose-6-phosphate transaminase (isomerizing) [Actinoplanes missouriensis]BAL92447.1 putative L-glutamine-D-fructose-6-phosphate amidotransferase [Actinoplanes missouriensis 431]
MCGIVGYAGGRPALDIVMDGLRRLEYRGYDSAGVAVVDAGAATLLTEKAAGKLVNLEKALAERIDTGFDVGATGIGHTRWATHGGPTDRNAHPHVSADGRVAVIHNGIIENFARLRASLEADGVAFTSDTDTEAAAHLLAGSLVAAHADELAGPAALAEAMRRTARQLEGAFTLLAVSPDAPGAVVAARRNSPLVVGRGDGENFLASDVSAFMEHTRSAIELGQDQVVLITADRIEITGFDGTPSSGTDLVVDWDVAAAEKGGYDFYMLKEIAEQPQAVAATLLTRMPDLDFSGVQKVIIVACGTAYHAGMIAGYAIEQWARIGCDVELASEFRYRDPLIDEGTLVIAISQSGETMDTLMALRHAKAQGARVLAICNTNGSTIPRESDAVLYTHGGPEIAVASTKAFLTQLVACYLVGLRLAAARGLSAPGVQEALRAVPDQLRTLLESSGAIRELAYDLATARQVLFLGRHVGYPVALEGALKLKELAYMHAEGFAAGELKHGPIALIDEGTPVICVVPAPTDALHDKMVSNIQEVRARGARTIVIAEQGDEAVAPFADAVIPVPATPALLAPLLTTVPMQILACETAAARGHDVDQPRNLAKSVTVE